jgi:hypothetical protein
MKLISSVSFKRIVLTVVVTIGLSPQSVFSQSKYLHVTKNEKGNAVKYSDRYTHLKSAFSNSTIYYSAQYPIDKEIVIHTYNTETKESGKVKIENPKSAKAMLSERLESFAVNGNKLAVISSDHVLIFELTSKSSMRCIATLENKLSFRKCLPLGDGFLLYVNYKFHPLDAEHNHVWAKLNVNKKEIENVKIQSDQYSVFGSLLNSWIDTRGSKVVYADPLNYAITFYDENFVATDSIRSNEFDGNKFHYDNFTRADEYSKEAIYGLMAVDDSLLTRIRKVYYLNDSTVMALITRPGSESVRADYWQKRDGTWNRIYQDFSTPWFADGASYSKEQLTYADFMQNVYDFPYAGNNSFFLPYFPYIPVVTTSNFNRNTDYFKPQNDAIQQKELYFGIRQVSIDFPIH